MWCTASLVPRPPLFLPSVCIHNNTWERKTDEKQESLGAIITWVGTRWTWGGRGRYSNIYTLNLKASSLLVKKSSFHHAKVWNTKHGRALERMVLCTVLAVGSLPPYVHLMSTWCHSRDECSQAFPVLIFRQSSVLLWTQREDQNRGGLGPRLVHSCHIKLGIHIPDDNVWNPQFNSLVWVSLPLTPKIMSVHRQQSTQICLTFRWLGYNMASKCTAVGILVT